MDIALMSGRFVASVMAVLVFLLARVFRHPALFHWLWILVLLRLVIPPLIVVPIPISQQVANVQLDFLPGSSSTAVEIAPSADEASVALPEEVQPSLESSVAESDGSFQPATSTGDDPEQDLSDKNRISPGEPIARDSTGEPVASDYHISLVACLIVVWIAGAAALLVRMLFKIVRFQRLLKFASPADAELQAIVREQAERMKLRRVPQALIVPGTISPILWTLRRRAALLLPKQLLEELSAEAVERGVSFVEVSLNGSPGNNAFAWDTHQQNFPNVQRLCGILDPAWSSLLEDLRDRGMLETTQVLWMGEFGRTPRINPQAGRDHFPAAWSVALCGGGIRGGQVIGQTSDDGMTVTDRPVTTIDLLATICRSLGINPDDVNMSNVGRPIPLVDPAAVPVPEAIL